MKKTKYLINKMDCPSEERLIRMKLESLSSIQYLRFDLVKRELEIIHSGMDKEIEESIDSLNLDARILESGTTADQVSVREPSGERSVLITVLLINLTLFLVELITGFVSHSLGLVADSLDMLADSIVYGLSLYAVGRAVSRKKKIARISAYFQFLLAVTGFAEVVRRFLGYEEMPVFQTMIGISIIALLGNAACLAILRRHREGEVHLRASWIFTSNDVIVNLGVILAGGMVYLTRSVYPDLVIGSIVFSLVARGALRIYKLSK